jgi:peptide/nickel transport system permease protein
MSKGSAISVLGDDYINAAVARGLPQRIIDKRYLKKNAMLPLVTGLVISFAYLFGGSAVMESVFSYPGIGRAFVNFIGRRDYFVVQGLFVFLSVFIIGANLFADFIIGILDPRIRTS